MLKYTKQFIFLGLISLMLTACGGSSNNGAASPGPTPSNLVITISPVKESLQANVNGLPITLESPFYTQVNVSVKYSNGTAIQNGTDVSFSTSNAQIAPISTLDDPETTDVNEFTTLYGQVTNKSSGGSSTFFVHTVNKLFGNVELTASVTDPKTGRTSTATINYEITEGPAPFERLTIEAQRNPLPANVFNLTPQQAWRTVYMTEVTISFRDPFGNFVNPAAGSDGKSTVGVSISNLEVAGFSTGDDPSTPDVNETFALLIQGPVNMVAGKGTIYVWARDPGTATLTVNASDQHSGQTLSKQYSIEVISSDNGLPDSISMRGGGHNYVNGSGGSQSQQIQVNLTDAGQPAENPNGFNNVLVSFTTEGNPSGEYISGNDINGNVVSGRSIKLGTTSGIATLSLHSGQNPNEVRITAIADRADNNVDNGLQSPIEVTKSFSISDGVLFGLDITIAEAQNFFVNGVSGNVSLSAGTGQLDGTYSMGVSVIGTDKGGNPALPQNIKFGLIDSPLNGFPNEGHGVFAVSGVDGDPQEGGKLFTSASATFRTTANGVQRGDTLLVLGEDIHGNEDLESAVTVQSVNSETRLTIAERFNRNNLTGTVVNDGPIFPYMIGRAVDGNIEATAMIGDNGVANTTLNFPVSKLGKRVAIYASGTGATVNGSTRAVTDVEQLIYPGLAAAGERKAFLIAYPGQVAANGESTVVVCTYDALGHPLQGRSINWYFTGAGNGFIDDVRGSGTMDNRTGAEGCATGRVRTGGIVSQSSDSGFNFNSGNLTCVTRDTPICVRVASPGTTFLTAMPNSFVTSGHLEVRLTLVGADGQGIEGASITGVCQSSGGTLEVSAQPGPTDADGNTTATVLSALDGIRESHSGTCTFTAQGTGGPSVTVSFRGRDLCIGTSPAPPGC